MLSSKRALLSLSPFPFLYNLIMICTLLQKPFQKAFFIIDDNKKGG